MSGTDEAGSSRLQRMKEALGGRVFWRHVATICISVTLAAAPTLFAAGVIWANMDNKLKGHDSALADHSGELDRIKNRIWPIERSLADGTGPLTVKNHGEVLKDLTQFVADQRELNGALKVQVQSTADAVDKVQDTVGALQTDVKAILNNLQRRSGPP